MSSTEHGPKRWRELALECLATAEELTHADAKAIMVRLAAGYERLAEQAEKNAKLLEHLARIAAPNEADGTNEVS